MACVLYTHCVPCYGMRGGESYEAAHWHVAEVLGTTFLPGKRIQRPATKQSQVANRMKHVAHSNKHKHTPGGSHSPTSSQPHLPPAAH